MSKAKKSDRPRERKKLPLKTVTLVLTEAGYRCAVPTCRGILALDMHHIWEVTSGGGDEPSNLIALCPTCHSLYHRGTISADSIYAYKAMLVAISRAFDLEAVDRLLFLSMCPKDYLVLSGDGLLHFARLIAGGLAWAEQKSNNNWELVTYAVNISDKGQQLIHAWNLGDRTMLAQALSGPVVAVDSSGGGPPEQSAITRPSRYIGVRVPEFPARGPSSGAR
jgi:HNH endonuclease